MSSSNEFLAEWGVSAWLLINRMAGYALINFLDDPAMLALAFC